MLEENYDASTSPSSTPPPTGGGNSTRRKWIEDARQDYFLVELIQGRMSAREKFVAEVAKEGYDKTFILKRQSCSQSIKSEFLALSIAPTKDSSYMLVAHEFFSMNGVHYFVYEKEDTDMFTIMTNPTFHTHRRRSAVETYIRQMALAVQYLHSHRVVHYDIKFENMVVNLRTHNLRLIDFESCKLWHQPKYFLGTEDYMAPEILLCRSISTYEPGKQDIWSLGILFAVILLNKGPIDSHPRRAKDYHAFLQKLPVHPIISRCLQFHPKDRVDIHQLVDRIVDSEDIFTKTTTLYPSSPTTVPPNEDDDDKDSSSEKWNFSNIFPSYLLSN